MKTILIIGAIVVVLLVGYMLLSGGDDEMSDTSVQPGEESASIEESASEVGVEEVDTEVVELGDLI